MIFHYHSANQSLLAANYNHVCIRKSTKIFFFLQNLWFIRFIVDYLRKSSILYNAHEQKITDLILQLYNTKQTGDNCWLRGHTCFNVKQPNTNRSSINEQTIVFLLL